MIQRLTLPAARTARSPQSLVFPVAAIALPVAVGAYVASVSPDSRQLLLAALGLSLAAPVATRLASKRFDVLEPLIWVLVAFLVMFFVRPIALIHFDEFRDTKDLYDIEETFDKALLLALVGLWGYLIGYATPLARRWGRRARVLPTDLAHATVTTLAWGLIALAIVGYAAFAIQAGIPLSSLFSGGLKNDSTASTAYLYNAPFLCVPAALLLISTGLQRRAYLLVLVAIGLVAVFIVSLAPSGQRLWLLVLLTSFAVYPMLRSRWRPTPVLAILVILPAFFGIVSLRDLHGDRDAPGVLASMQATAAEPAAAWREFITGPDTEMVTFLALELKYIPASLPFEPGHSLLELAARPTPGVLWPTKPAAADGVVNAYVYSERGVESSDAASAFSLLGVFWFDGGFPAVFLGMALLGFVMRGFWEYLQANIDNDNVVLLYASLLPLFVVLLRGNPSDTLARGLFTVAPLVVVPLVAKRLSPRP